MNKSAPSLVEAQSVPLHAKYKFSESQVVSKETPLESVWSVESVCDHCDKSPSIDIVSGVEAVVIPAIAWRKMSKTSDTAFIRIILPLCDTFKGFLLSG